MATALLVAGPAALDLYWLRILTNVFMFATLAQALNVIAGYTGYPAFGNVVFYGLGAYTTGILMVRYGLPPAAAFAGSVASSAALALLVGPAMLRLRGHYFAIGTLALNEATRALVENMPGLTGGGQGLSLPIPSGSVEASARLFYYLFLGTMLLAAAIVVVVLRNRLGYALRAVRAGEETAESLGVHTTRAKTTAWVVSATLTGLAGGIYAYWISYIDPAESFSLAVSVKVFVIMLLGGIGTVIGPIAGAFFVELLETTVWSNFLTYHTAILGFLIVLVVLFLPGGIASFARDRAAASVRLFTGAR